MFSYANFFLTWRYLSRRPLSLVAVAMLSLSLWALVTAPSIMSGFQEEFHKRIRGTLSDVNFYHAQPFKVPEDPELEAALEALPNVVSVAPYMDNPALDSHLGDKIDYCFLRGVDPYKEERVSEFANYLMSERDLAEFKAGFVKDPERKKLELQIAGMAPAEVDRDQLYRQLTRGLPDRPAVPTCLVGIYFLHFWRLEIGDSLLLTTATDAGEVSKDREFVIVGAFRTGFSKNDRRNVIMSLSNMQQLVGTPGRISGYSINLADFRQVKETKARVRQAIQSVPSMAEVLREDPYVRIQTWQEHDETLLKAVQMEKLLIRLIIFIIVIAASSSIFLVLFMTVHTKLRELGILRAVGSTAQGVLSLFVGQGLLLALLGMLIGLGLGILTSLYINEVADLIEAVSGWHPFPKDIYYLEEIPSKIDPIDNLVNFGITLALGSVAAVVPGLLAALRPPLKAIRHD